MLLLLLWMCLCVRVFLLWGRGVFVIHVYIYMCCFVCVLCVRYVCYYCVLYIYIIVRIFMIIFNVLYIHILNKLSCCVFVCPCLVRCICIVCCWLLHSLCCWKSKKGVLLVVLYCVCLLAACAKCVVLCFYIIYINRL